MNRIDLLLVETTALQLLVFASIWLIRVYFLIKHNILKKKAKKHTRDLNSPTQYPRSPQSHAHLYCAYIYSACCNPTAPSSNGGVFSLLKKYFHQIKRLSSFCL